MTDTAKLVKKVTTKNTDLNDPITIYTELFNDSSTININDNSQVITYTAEPIINNYNNTNQLTGMVIL